MQVLKNHGLFGLNEAQLRILLLQNDPCLLPEVSYQEFTLMLSARWKKSGENIKSLLKEGSRCMREGNGAVLTFMESL